jgi:hypothetical protein
MPNTYNIIQTYTQKYTYSTMNTVHKILYKNLASISSIALDMRVIFSTIHCTKEHKHGWLGQKALYYVKFTGMNLRKYVTDNISE